MAGLLAGKVALVTGGGACIGRAAALAFAREGAKVIVSGRSTASGEETVRMIRVASGEALWVKADVSQAAEVEALINTAVETYGRLDCAFNNAGIEGVLASTAECTEENWDRTMAVNLKGVWLCLKYEIPQMLKQGHGAIVNNASALGLGGIPTLPAYVASKHGVVGLTKTAALEYAKLGLRINAVCPGAIRTPLYEERIFRTHPHMEEVVTALEPVGRMGKAEEVAAAVVWLCSAAAAFVTGHAMAVDGGWVAQ
jgi:NAD(P)-dependent dehydrogenase (short-subunit alcohol dehydrogenase family)